MFFLLLVFFPAPCASFSRQNLHRVYHSNLLCGRGNLLFIALCVGMQGRKEEGKTMVSMETRPKKPTQSRCHFCLVLDHQNCLTAVELSVSGEGISRGLLIKTLSSFLCLFKPPLVFFSCLSGSKSAVSVFSIQWILVDDCFALGLQQCQWTNAWALRVKTGGERDQEEKGKKRKKCRPSFYRTGAQKREEYSLLLSHAISFTLFLSCQRHNKAKQTWWQRYFLSPSPFVYIL